MRIALVFWGLTRSLTITYPNIKKYILEHLKNNNIEYKIFLHTYYFKDNYTDKRTGEENIKLDFDEYKLLNPDYLLIDNQDEIKKKINIQKYHKYKYSYNFQTTNNLICALYSQFRITQLLENKVKDGNHFDFVWYLRPDIIFNSKLPLHWFKWINDNRFLVPNFGNSGGINDRMAIMKYHQALNYGKRFLNIIQYGENMKDNKIISERFLYAVMYQFKIKKIKYYFKRMRANGEIHYLDKNLF